MSASAKGRRILIAVVTGDLGRLLQEWREKHDPEQARRLPPHVTLCYQAPTAEEGLLEAQVRHAFQWNVSVRLGSVAEFQNKDHTFYVEVSETQELDDARERLYDGRFLTLPRKGNWAWHVTCVRYGAKRDHEAVRRAAKTLVVDSLWHVERVAYMELRNDRYESICDWNI